MTSVAEKAYNRAKAVERDVLVLQHHSDKSREELKDVRNRLSRLEKDVSALKEIAKSTGLDEVARDVKQLRDLLKRNQKERLAYFMKLLVLTEARTILIPRQSGNRLDDAESTTKANERFLKFITNWIWCIDNWPDEEWTREDRTLTAWITLITNARNS